MHFSKTIALLGAGIIAGASPTSKHIHQRLHAVKRTQPYTTVDVPGPTIIQYVVNGEVVSHEEVCKGIEAGSLVWKNPSDGLSKCSSSSSAAIGNPTSTSMVIKVSPSLPTVVMAQNQNVKTTPASSPSSVTTEEEQAIKTTPASSPSSVAVDRTQDVSTIPVQSTQAPELPASSVSNTPKQSATTTSSDSAPVFTSSAAESSLVGNSSFTPDNISEGQGLELEFPDGTIDCSIFPSQYGPIEIEWARLGGWAGIQYITVEGDSVTNIVTAVPGGQGCIPGAMCSYACPPGYQKSQWPPTQGDTGQSVGGILCNSAGKLSLTNPGLSKTLCIKGTGAAIVQNKLSSNVAICRTDYPGTENEVVPLNTQPGSTNPLTCPDAKTYFKWYKDMPTSAQYYINNQGVDVEKACIWNTDGSDMGNWAPSFLGVGQDLFGKTWLSVSSTAQNNPISYSPLNFTVTLQGDISGNCRLSNGKYCTGDNYDDCNDQGCTVELMSGQATYALSD